MAVVSGMVAVSDSLYSSYWHRVANLSPCLQAQVEVRRVRHREQVWHQLIDRSTGKRHRLNRAAWHFIGRFDGRITVDQAWHQVLKEEGDDTLSQHEALQLLEQLGREELLQCSLPPDVESLFRQHATQSRRERLAAMNPFFLRVNLFDPSRLLMRCERILPFVFSRTALLLWCVLLVPALLLALRNWSELQAFASVYVDSPRHLFMAWLAYPLIKALHEASHALAVRRWGGEVHKAGLSFFVLVPVPYVDASSASEFPLRRQRALVSAAGIMAELAIAAAAMFVWANVQAGLVRDAAFMTMLICGFSSLLVNGNPLLRFDGYYLLCDLIDVPNLDPRSRQWWTAMVQRMFLGRTQLSVPLAKGERKWMVLYAPLAWTFRLLLGIQLTIWAAGKSVLLGMAIAVMFIGVMLAGPLRALGRLGHQLYHADGRRASKLAFFSGIGVASVVLFVLPLPFGATAEAVLRVPDNAQVRVASEGYVRAFYLRDGEAVAVGQVLAVLENPELDAELNSARSRLAALQAEQYLALQGSRAQVLAFEKAIFHTQAEVARLEERAAQLVIRSRVAGHAAAAKRQSLEGSFLKKGTALGYVIAADAPVARAVVPHTLAGLVKERTHGVSVHLADRKEDFFPARVTKDMPADGQRLPSPALSDRNGGSIPTDPSDKEQLQALTPFFMVDLEIPGLRLERVEGRAWAHFDFGTAPLAYQWSYRLRQLLLQHFGEGA